MAAYASDESGRYEVYVQSFPGGGGKRQVSTGGGNNPRWRRDGRELFYHAGDGKLMAVPVRSGESLEAGAAVPLFEFRSATVGGNAAYAVTGDGQRFLINAVVETEPITDTMSYFYRYLGCTRQSPSLRVAAFLSKIISPDSGSYFSM
jgi:hypothetical protein